MNVGLYLQLATTVILFVIGAALSVIGWYLRGEYREHKKNTAVRRYLVGDPNLDQIDDEGYVEDVEDRFDALEHRLEEQHRKQNRELHEVKQLVERIAAQIETHDDFDFTRGSKSRHGSDDD